MLSWHAQNVIIRPLIKTPSLIVVHVTPGKIRIKALWGRIAANATIPTAGSCGNSTMTDRPNTNLRGRTRGSNAQRAITNPSQKAGILHRIVSRAMRTMTSIKDNSARIAACVMPLIRSRNISSGIVNER